jgi:hypothetical protein
MYTKLASLQYIVVYELGSSNLVADALSRHLEPPSQVAAISYSSPTWLVEVADGYQANPSSTRLLQELLVDPLSHPPYTLHGSLICCRNQIWIGDNKVLHSRLLQPCTVAPSEGILVFQ